MSWPWKKRKFRAYKFLDSHDIEMVAAEYDDKPFWLSIGTTKGRKTHTAVDVGKEQIGAERDFEKSDMYWEHFVNPRNLPPFMPIEKAKTFMQGSVANTSGTLSVYTSSNEPIVYEDKNTIENVVRELDIPSVKVDEVIDLSAEFFIKNLKVELEYPHIFSGSELKPIWEPLFHFINLMDTSTIISTAELINEEGEILSIDDKLNIELRIGTSSRSHISLPLHKSIKEQKYIEGTICFTHTHGETTYSVNYDLGDALFERKNQ